MRMCWSCFAVHFRWNSISVFVETVDAPNPFLLLVTSSGSTWGTPRPAGRCTHSSMSRAFPGVSFGWNIPGKLPQTYIWEASYPDARAALSGSCGFQRAAPLLSAHPISKGDSRHPVEKALSLTHSSWPEVIMAPSLQVSGFPKTDTQRNRTGAFLNKWATNNCRQNITSLCSVFVPGDFPTDLVVLWDKCGCHLELVCSPLKCTHNSAISKIHLRTGGTDFAAFMLLKRILLQLWLRAVHDLRPSSLALKTSNFCFTPLSQSLCGFLCSPTSSVLSAPHDYSKLIDIDRIAFPKFTKFSYEHPQMWSKSDERAFERYWRIRTDKPGDSLHAFISL